MVTNQYDPAAIHAELLDKIKSVHMPESCVTDRILLMSVIQNYRTGAGLRLSNFGFKLCNENHLYKFVKCDYTDVVNSTLLTSLDRTCSGPYFIDGNYIYLSDDYLAALLMLHGKEFERVFDVFD